MKGKCAQRERVALCHSTRLVNHPTKISYPKPRDSFKKRERVSVENLFLLYSNCHCKLLSTWKTVDALSSSTSPFYVYFIFLSVVLFISFLTPFQKYQLYYFFFTSCPFYKNKKVVFNVRDFLDEILIVFLSVFHTVCPPGKYKHRSGDDDKCQTCPDHSMAPYSGSSECRCNQNYYRALKDPKSMPCTRKLLIAIQSEIIF